MKKNTISNSDFLKFRISVSCVHPYSAQASCATPRTLMRRITTFRSTTDHIYDGGPIILYYIILYYNTYHSVKIAYSIQYSNMLYRFVA